MLRATTACTFSTSQLPKVVRTPSALYILTSKCALRHNGVQFFISHLASWLRTRRFSEPTVRPSGATNHWKNTVFRDVPTFSRTCIFFLLIFSLLTLLTSAFQLSILSEVSLLNFLRQKGVPTMTNLLSRSGFEEVDVLQGNMHSLNAVRIPLHLQVQHVKDAFLMVPQAEALKIKVGNKSYVVLRNLPGQRQGARSWYQFRRAFLDRTFNVEWCLEQPCLCRGWSLSTHACGRHHVCRISKILA